MLVAVGQFEEVKKYLSKFSYDKATVDRILRSNVTVGDIKALEDDFRTIDSEGSG